MYALIYTVYAVYMNYACFEDYKLGSFLPKT